jgi:hypothetical protein
LNNKKAATGGFSDPVARRVTLRYLAAPMTAATLLLWIDRSPTLLLLRIYFDRRAVVAGNDGGNTTTLDRQEPDIATAPNIPLTAAVVVGNDGGKHYSGSIPTLLLSIYL